MKDLLHLRFFGHYQKDLPGFISKLEEIKSAKSASPAMGMTAGTPFNPSSAEGASTLMDSMMGEIMAEKSIMERDIALQMKMKENSFLKMRKLDEKDLVKPRKSENLMFRDQLETIDDTIEILKRDNKYLLNEGADFENGK
mmetsp:Transcript_24320/g.37599  ORF Transcript_24320/g.37599 Transcript_24320/m.37599 type:complete len:141 (+) Transcript_24320:5569-5991(+)